MGTAEEAKNDGGTGRASHSGLSRGVGTLSTSWR